MGSKALRVTEISQSSEQTETAAISEQERHQMIAESAYYNAELRGFNGGSPETDWLQAEAKINEQLHL